MFAAGGRTHTCTFDKAISLHGRLRSRSGTFGYITRATSADGVLHSCHGVVDFIFFPSNELSLQVYCRSGKPQLTKKPSPQSLFHSSKVCHVINLHIFRPLYDPKTCADVIPDLNHKDTVFFTCSLPEPQHKDSVHS